MGSIGGTVFSPMKGMLELMKANTCSIQCQVWVLKEGAKFSL